MANCLNCNKEISLGVLFCGGRDCAEAEGQYALLASRGVALGVSRSGAPTSRPGGAFVVAATEGLSCTGPTLTAALKALNEKLPQLFALRDQVQAMHVEASEVDGKLRHLHEEANADLEKLHQHCLDRQKKLADDRKALEARSKEIDDARFELTNRMRTLRGVAPMARPSPPVTRRPD